MPHPELGVWHSRVMAATDQKVPYLVVIDNGDRSYYKMCSRNGQTLLTSETYKTPRNADRAARKTAEQLGLEVKERPTKGRKVEKSVGAV